MEEVRGVRVAMSGIPLTKELGNGSVRVDGVDGAAKTNSLHVKPFRSVHLLVQSSWSELYTSAKWVP